MRFASSITDVSDVDEAVDQLLRPIDARLTRGMVDLVVLFATAHYDDDMEYVLERLAGAFPHALTLGGTAYGTIGCDKEIERLPSMSLLAGCLPDVSLWPFDLRQADLEAAQGIAGWERLVGASPESNPVFLAWADPFRVDISGFVEQINEAFPGAPLFGGVSSAASQPGQNLLFTGGKIFREGIVGVALSGHVAVDGVVSQGCRPIGRPFVVTKAKQNIVQELSGHPPLTQLDQVVSKLLPAEQALVRESLFMGRVIDEYKEESARGDFLIHHIIGVDQETGAMAIGGPARVGTTMQFHVRDAASADEDLREAIARHAGSDVRGALLFGCNGRGTHMWPEPGHDVGVFRELVGDVPLAGFFCAGEFGPVGDRNYVHGFTASIAMFREPTGKDVDEQADP